jgi:hypothetical protein
MEVSRADLTQRFELLSDEDLLASLRSGTLTPLATEVAGNILSSRGVDPASFPGTADSTESAVGIDEGESDLVTVSVQWDAMKANLLRTLLEAHGIFVHMWGEHLATTHVFLSNAGGGTRLQVRSNQVSQANELIGAFERGELESRDLSNEDADAAPITRSNPYKPPANPYAPSPATIAARPTDRASARPLKNRFEAGSKLTAAQQSDKKPRAPSSPLRKAGLLIAGSAIIVALWFVFTH